MPKLCIVCRTRKPTLPDRNRMGRPIKRVCSECHRERLRGDLKQIMDDRDKALREKIDPSDDPLNWRDC